MITRKNGGKSSDRSNLRWCSGRFATSRAAIFLPVAWLLFGALVHSIAAEPQRVGPVTVELISPQQSIMPGEQFPVGLHIVPDEDWHVYWKNPGDAGMPPKLTWDLRTGFQAGEIEWPAPKRIDLPPLTSYGYPGAVLYPLTITPSDRLKVGDTAWLTVTAEWLVCKEKCLPGTATLSLSLPVADRVQLDSRWTKLFESTYDRVPRPQPQNWAIQVTADKRFIVVDIDTRTDLSNDSEIEFFPAKKGVVEHAAEQPVTLSDGFFRLELRRSPYSQDVPDRLEGVLAIKTRDSISWYDVSVPLEEMGDFAATAGSSAVSTPLIAVCFAFLGGLLLNLMPCVLPVLSLKVLGLVKQAGEQRRAALGHGLMFTGGVIVTFWLVAGVMLMLQAGGAHLGWGFQMQSPVFVTVLAGVMFLFALNLFGVYDIPFTDVSGRLTAHRAGYPGAFLSGVLATVVATPCTAPFMGAALGFSLTQPPSVSLLIYTSLGLGMAAPYLLLSSFPGLLRFVPRPGRWMETLKQFLGFLLAATVVWLAWVLAGQAGTDAVIILLAVLLLLAMTAWSYGRWGGLTSSRSIRAAGRLTVASIVVGVLATGAFAVNQLGYRDTPARADDATGIAWEPFNSARLHALRRAGQPVFIDFTAAWCLSCQVNERVAFSSPEVQQRFIALGIVPLKADWTHRSKEITQALASFGRNSVPLYVLYGTERNRDPVLLPEILTPGIVLEALNKIDNQRNL